MTQAGIKDSHRHVGRHDLLSSLKVETFPFSQSLIHQYMPNAGQIITSSAKTKRENEAHFGEWNKFDHHPRYITAGHQSWPCFTTFIVHPPRLSNSRDYTLTWYPSCISVDRPTLPK